MKINVYDTTLRDGEQGAGVYFSLADKLAVIKALNELGCDYIEAGNVFSSGKDLKCDSVFDNIDYSALDSKICAFSSTRKPNGNSENDIALSYLANSEIPVITIFGKSWDYQVENILKTSKEENLAMIADSISFLKEHGKEVIYDAEHFFDGYSDNPAYALSTIRTAYNSGADEVVLCDTNGGNLPDVIGMIVEKVKAEFPELKLGIHCHNDLGMAVACSLEAVLCGASSVQGSISGIGERCGNANLCSIIPLLQLKMGFKCLDNDKLSTLTQKSRHICEIANISFNENQPFVGGYAFAHKAGMHIDGVIKTPKSFEHIEPERIGNSRLALISSMSGRAAIYDKISAILPQTEKDSCLVDTVLETVRNYSAKGYSYENADASLNLIIRDAIGQRKKFYEILNYQIIINESTQGEDMLCTAMIKVKVDDKEEITAAEGEGPVNAFDLALRKALTRFYPSIKNMHLTDYKVRVIDDNSATASNVRVFIESTDGNAVWGTIGVSADIVDASRQALGDAIEYFLYNNGL